MKKAKAMQVSFSYKGRVNSGLIKGPWRLIEGEIFSYDASKPIKTSCANEEFSKLLIRIEDAILKNETSNYHGFCVVISPSVIDHKFGDPYRVFHWHFMKKGSSLRGWQWLPNAHGVFSQSDTLGDEELNSNPDFDKFFKELRSRFQKNSFPARYGRGHDELALFLE